MYPTSPELAQLYQRQMHDDVQRHQMARAFRRLRRVERRAGTHERRRAVEAVHLPRVCWAA